MAMASCGQIQWPPVVMNGLASNTNFTAAVNLTYDSDTDRLAWVGRSPVTDTLSKVYFRTNTVTTGCTVDVKIETVTNGRPSGSLVAAGATASVAIADSDDNAWKTATIGTPPSLNAGDEFAIIITVDTTGATPAINFAAAPAGTTTSPWMTHYPLILQDTGAGTWTSPGNAFCWIVEFGTAGVVPMRGMLPFATAGAGAAGTTTAYNSGSSPDEVALRFVLPFKARCIGIMAAMFNGAAGADFTASLWDATGDADNEALAQETVDGDYVLTAGTTDGLVVVMLNTPVTLTAGATYYAGIRADTANNISVAEVANATVTNALLAFPGVNANTYRASRTWTAGDADDWTTTTTTLPMIYLIIDQLDDGNGNGNIGGAMNRGFGS